MKKFALLSKGKGLAKKVIFSAKKHSPEILMVTGVIGTVASTIMACKATLKVNDILDETKENLDKIHECAGKPELAEKYTEHDAKKDTAIVYVQTGLKFVKLYAPAITLGVLSIGSMVASNHILRKRNAAMAAAYATLDSAFKTYRGRVVERFGEEVDKELKYGVKAVEVKEKEEGEDGKTKTVKKTLNVVDPNDPSTFNEYTRIFGPGNPIWQKDHMYNLMFLRAQQSYFNDKLRVDGMVFLNDVYKALGIPISKAGQYVGWVYDPKNENAQGDNYIDFGIYEAFVPSDTVEGKFDKTIVLDFNVDGNILASM